MVPNCDAHCRPAVDYRRRVPRVCDPAFRRATAVWFSRLSDGRTRFEELPEQPGTDCDPHVRAAEMKVRDHFGIEQRFVADERRPFVFRAGMSRKFTSSSLRVGAPDTNKPWIVHTEPVDALSRCSDLLRKVGGAARI